MKKAIIIGATSGIGKGLAEILAKSDYLVGITGRRSDLLEKIKSEMPGRYFVKTADVTDTGDTIRRLDELVAELGGLDLLIISSGTGDLNDDLGFEIEKRTIETNVTGFTCIAGWAFRYFKGQGSGHLAAISSIAGIRGSRQAPSYGATKAYQINYLEALRHKAARLKKPIYVTDIRPGFVNTAMAKGDGQFWVAPVERAANQIFSAIKKKKKVAYITKRWALIAFILKLLPKTIYDRM